ncbi:TPA: hypothetical protein I8Y21_006268 [Klebsiella oxytoca]|uniref:Uncharacterized protein n=1 Tax=Klebsiella oxytoca TaxID=571 RepID=A0AAN5LFY7_KLEOX|nr:hypothetical protein [Klebsiella oxytoca]
MSCSPVYYFKSRPDEWSDVEIRALRCLYLRNVPISDIAYFLCRSVYGVKYQLYKRKLNNRRIRYTEHDLHIIKKYAGKKSASFIASLINHPLGSVRTYAGVNGISLIRYGDNAYNVKYPDEDVLLMRALYDEGLRICDIALKFEIDQHVVRILIFYRFISADYYLRSSRRLGL